MGRQHCQDGLQLQGQAQANAGVVVQLGALQQSVTADASGHWQATWDTATMTSVGAGLQRWQSSYTNGQGERVSESTNLMVVPGAMAPRASRALTADAPALHIGFYSSAELVSKYAELLPALGNELGPYYGGPYSDGVWQSFANQGVRAPYAIVGTTYEAIKAEVVAVLQDPVKNNSIWAWYGPEEVQYWVDADFSGLQTKTRAIRDAEMEMGEVPRPFYQYLPNHADIGRANSFVGVNDLMSKGTYFQVGASNADHYASIRDAADVMVTASRNKVGSQTDGGAVGADFTPFLTLSAFSDPAQGVSEEKLTAVLRTGFYLALSRGVQGIDIWSYVTRSGFSTRWRDAYVNSYVAAGTELNVIEPDLGVAIAQGLRLENLPGVSTPINISSSSSLLSSARFYYKGQIYVMLVNPDESQSATAELSELGDFAQYQELLTPSTMALQTATSTLSLSVAPESVRIWRFIDPLTPAAPLGAPPTLHWDAEHFMLRQGRGGTEFVGGLANVVSPEAFGIQDVEARGASHVHIDIWWRDASTVHDWTSNYFYRADKPTQSVTEFSLQELQSGLINFQYNGQTKPPSFSVRLTDDRGVASDWFSVQASFVAQDVASNTGLLLFGDGSGGGGGASSSSPSGVSGGGGSDVMVGTAKADIILGDGSGGGEGDAVYSSGYVSGRAGQGGGGNDTLSGGGGDDVIFGDGFAGTPSVGKSGPQGGTLGGYGGGGNGALSSWRSQTPNALGGGLAGSAEAGAFPDGGQSTFGAWGVPFAAKYSGTQRRPAPGLGVSANAVYENGATDEDRVETLLDASVYSTVLRDLQKGAGADARPFTQVMGQGHDWIDGGAGNDWIMGGGGADTIIGGTGNDVMWGSGGGRGLPIDVNASAYTTSPTTQVDLIFLPMEQGQSLSVNGLTFTASRYLSATQAASAWADLSTTAGKPASSEWGTYSGSWGNTWVTGARAEDALSILSSDGLVRWDLLGTMSTNAGPVRENNVFVWEAGDAAGGSVDVIKDFVAWNAELPGDGPKGDRLDIGALLEGYAAGDALANWLSVSQGTVNGKANSTRIDIDTNGFGHAGGDVQTIWLEGVDLVGPLLVPANVLFIL